MNKICPLMSRTQLLIKDGHLSNESMLHKQECLKEKCALWAKVTDCNDSLMEGCAFLVTLTNIKTVKRD